jgi:hypothetical protein
MKILNYTLINWVYIIAVFSILTGLIIAVFKHKPKILFAFFYLAICSILFVKFKGIFIHKIGLFLILPSLLIGALYSLLTFPEKVDELWDCPFPTNKGMKFVKNVRRGILIFASAGSGKTESPIYSLLKHFANKDFSGIIYDYKDGELSEIAKPLFADRLKVVCIHKPYIGLRINPLSERYISDEKDINEVVNVIIDNLGSGKGDNFFTENATALLSAVILKFHFHHRDMCTIPHIIAFILACDFSEQTDSRNLGEQAQATFGKLKKFLLEDKRVAIQGSAFIMGLASEKQTAAVLSTLANALRKMAFPESFWVLSGDDLFLDVNNPEVNSVITILNEPKADSFLTPIIATIIHTATKQMMVRGRKQSFVLLDEAPTIKLRNMAKIPATMRSFGVAVVYCAQDLAQGFSQYGRDGFKEITANLSTQFFGKANDPDTAKFYEGYFELVKEQTKSVQKGAGGSFFDSTKGTSFGEKEVSKVRASTFLKLGVGDFAFLSDGKSEVVKFSRPVIERELLDASNNLSSEKYKANYYKIIKDVDRIINSNIV